jgi:hypothetical protein
LKDEGRHLAPQRMWSLIYCGPCWGIVYIAHALLFA